MSQESSGGQRFSFEEYKLYYESTEKVTDRRIATNTWNYGLCTAIMVAVASLATWAVSRAEFRLVVIGAIFILAGMGALLCTLWLGQIRDFKNLNSAKFEILNAMAPLIQFAENEALISATPFEREWTILKRNEAAREVNTMRIVALRSSNAELLVPKAFRWLFLLLMAISFATSAANWTTLTGGLFDFKQPGSPSPASLVSPGNSLTGHP